MAAPYKSVQWNRHKAVYDVVIGGGIALYITVFIVVASATGSASANANLEILVISALGACAFFMLHAILAIGPLARISPAFLPLLYNRRHLGVSFFIVALSHATYATIWYHGYGVINPILSLFVSNPRYDAIGAFPFESLGALALLVFFVLAATSHDFWLKNLSPVVWKTVHMMIYPAYALAVLHVVLGAASGQGGDSGVYIWVTSLGFAFIAGLHIVAGALQSLRDEARQRVADAGWIDAGPAMDIPEDCARIISLPGGDGIAVFRYDGKISAVSNRCPHQMGPLGEGRIVNGRVTCPWHGRQYDPATGSAPPPLAGAIATFPVRLAGGRVYVNPIANPVDTRAEPAMLG
jgi:nitrite reductase/ring-hydroxylating ferredoxin subunit/DMSO/TMAO reductase YedYZ heme-binding membrane subunit